MQGYILSASGDGFIWAKNQCWTQYQDQIVVEVSKSTQYPPAMNLKKEFAYKNQAGMIKSWYQTDTGLEFGPSLDFKPLDFLRIQLSPQGPVKTRKSASDWLRWWE